MKATDEGPRPKDKGRTMKDQTRPTKDERGPTMDNENLGNPDGSPITNSKFPIPNPNSKNPDLFSTNQPIA